MIETKFKVGQEYRTRGGSRAVVAVIEKSEEEDLYPVKGIVFYRGVGGDWYAKNWTEDGRYYSNSEDQEDLIFPAETKRVPLEFGDILPGAHVRSKNEDAKVMSIVASIEMGVISTINASYPLISLFERTGKSHELEWRPDKDSPWRPFYKEVEV